MGTTQQVILTTTVTASAALTQQRFVGADNAPCQAGAVALGVAEVDAAVGDVTPVTRTSKYTTRPPTANGWSH